MSEKFKFGKNIIENLKTGMYKDRKIIYREYIQNSADSIDEALEKEIISKNEAEISIDIDNSKRNIKIKDNGIGIDSKNFEQIMCCIADSTKDVKYNKGFRGIGRLAGIAYCDKLIFSSKIKGENIISTCEIEAKEIRNILNDIENKMSADEVMELATKFYKKNSNDIDDHFFLVELKNVSNESSELLEKKTIKGYLEEVAPIPYTLRFKLYADKIKKFAKEHNFNIDEYKIKVNGEQIYKPYSTQFKDDSDNPYDELIDIDFKIFSNDKEDFAWMWFGLSRFEKSIPAKYNKMRGIRLRKENIQIGDDATVLKDFYKETRGYGYFIGELFAVNKGLVPNARRDYFNENETRTEFEEKIKPVFQDEFCSLYSNANKYKNNFKKVENLKKTEEEYDEKKKSGFISADEKKKLENEREKAKEEAIKSEKILKNCKAKADDKLNKVYNALEKQYSYEQEKEKQEIIPLNMNSSNLMVDKLKKLSQKEKNLLTNVYEIINNMLDKSLALSIIRKIQEELENK